ncbi:MAG: enoyl-CoA hydratase/isomerase family protein, partial [Janthinobacterium sp.]
MTATQDTQDTEAPLVLREEHDGLVTLRLNRPLQFNALSEAMLAALQEAFDAIAQQPHVRCVVLAAEGKAFCAGHDLRQMQATRRLAYYQTLFAQCSRVMQAI